MTWEMDWADRIEGHYCPSPPRERIRTLATSAIELSQLLVMRPPAARHAVELRAAYEDACNYGLNSSGAYVDLKRKTLVRLEQLEELEMHGHPATMHELEMHGHP